MQALKTDSLNALDTGSVPQFSEPTCGRERTERCPKVSSLWQRLSASRFPWEFPRLYALLLEVRSSNHRIQRLWRAGSSRRVEMGPVWDRTSLGCLTEITRTRSR